MIVIFQSVYQHGEFGTLFHVALGCLAILVGVDSHIAELPRSTIGFLRFRVVGKHAPNPADRATALSFQMRCTDLNHLFVEQPGVRSSLKVDMIDSRLA